MSSFLSTMTEKSNLQAERWSANRLRRRLNLASFLLLFALPLTSRVALAQSTPDFVWNRGGHGGNPTRATYSPDGALFATCSIDESTKLWRASDGQLVRTLVGELLPFPGNNTVTGLAFSADGTTLATCAWDYTVKLWRVSDGERLRTITLDGAFWNAVALSPDGQFVCAGGLPSGVIRMWNTGTGALVRSFTGHGDMVNDVEFSPDGTRLASASRDRTVRVWNAATGASLWSATAHDFEAVSIDFSPDGLVLASAGGISQPRVKTWNAASGAPIRTYVGQTNSSNDVEFSPDGSRIGGSGGDGKVRIWNTATGATERVLGVGNPPTICNFDFSPDGAELVAGDSERRVTMWNAASGTLVREASAHPGWVHAVGFAPDVASLSPGAGLSSPPKGKGMKTTTDILVSGGGIAGLTAAAAFGAAGFSVICVDPQPPVTSESAAGSDLRTTAFLQPSIPVLQAAGLWERLQPFAAPLQVMRIVDAGGPTPDPRIVKDFDAGDISDQPFGWNLPNWLLRREMVARLADLPNVSFRPGLGFARMLARESEALVTLTSAAAGKDHALVVAPGTMHGGAQLGAHRGRRHREQLMRRSTRRYLEIAMYWAERVKALMLRVDQHSCRRIIV